MVAFFGPSNYGMARAIADELVVALHVADVARVTDRHASASKLPRSATDCLDDLRIESITYAVLILAATSSGSIMLPGRLSTASRLISPRRVSA